MRATVRERLVAREVEVVDVVTCLVDRGAVALETGRGGA
jgi:hypothetical protein